MPKLKNTFFHLLTKAGHVCRYPLFSNVTQRLLIFLDVSGRSMCSLCSRNPRRTPRKFVLMVRRI